jgi:hypothetical protein
VPDWEIRKAERQKVRFGKLTGFFRAKALMLVFENRNVMLKRLNDIKRARTELHID